MRAHRSSLPYGLNKVFEIWMQILPRFKSENTNIPKSIYIQYKCSSIWPQPSYNYSVQLLYALAMQCMYLGE